MEARVLQPGTLLGRYSLSARLARGGMGEVWLATASGRGGFEKRLVLKTIRPERAESPVFIEMFAKEARLTARLNHPNLIDVFDFAEDGGVYFLAMEYLPGRSLAQIARAARRAGRPLPDWFVLRVLADCCRGLHYAHEQSGIIHCDLSPGNVMVAFTGLTKIVDFGVAQTRQAVRIAGSLNGKFPYMAPERIASQTTDCRSDVYSLGVILYQMFAGRLPFFAETDAELQSDIMAGDPPPPSRFAAVAPDIEAVIVRALAREPERRYQSAAELGQALEDRIVRRGNLRLEQDVALYLAALFPDASDIPANIRAQLASGTPARIARGETTGISSMTEPQRALTTQAEEPRWDAGPVWDAGPDWDIEIVVEDDSALRRPHFEPSAAPAIGEAEPAAADDLDDGVTRIQQLFSGTTAARAAGTPIRSPATAGRAASLFGDTEPGTSSGLAVSRRGWLAETHTRTGIFDGYMKRKGPEAEPWPWSTTIKKRGD